MTWTPLNALIVALCVYRLAVLAGRDIITDPLRRRLDEHVRVFVECPWCVGFWLAIVVVALVANEWGVVRWGCYVLAASAVAGFLAEHS